jgi:hypothetical protein
MRKPLKPSAAFSEAERARVTADCERFIDECVKPRLLPSIRPTEFNYPVDILGKWHGAKYRFIQRYRSGFPENLGEEFDAPFARLDWISPTASTSSGIATPENGYASIAASISSRRPKRSDPTVSSTPCRAQGGTFSRDAQCGLRRMDTGKQAPRSPGSPPPTPAKQRSRDLHSHGFRDRLRRRSWYAGPACRARTSRLCRSGNCANSALSRARQNLILRGVHRATWRSAARSYCGSQNADEYRPLDRKTPQTLMASGPFSPGVPSKY